PYGDDALPSGNAVAIRALLELGRLLDAPRYIDSATRALRAGMTDAGRWPSAHATLMRALLDVEQPPARVIVRAATAVPAAWQRAVEAGLDARGRLYAIPHGEPLPGRLATLQPSPGAGVTAWLQRGATTSAAITTLDALGAALDA
ncbi:MAG: thioredoxin domain-containing protein, partial [Gammaproteobacteria bacterium]